MAYINGIAFRFGKASSAWHALDRYNKFTSLCGRAIISRTCVVDSRHGAVSCKDCIKKMGASNVVL